MLKQKDNQQDPYQGQVPCGVLRSSASGAGERVPLFPLHHHPQEGRDRRAAAPLRTTGEDLVPEPPRQGEEAEQEERRDPERQRQRSQAGAPRIPSSNHRPASSSRPRPLAKHGHEHQSASSRHGPTRQRRTAAAPSVQPPQHHALVSPPAALPPATAQPRLISGNDAREPRPPAHSHAHFCPSTP
eukprot:GHVL01041296.1.p1 GENE.GHVL01041296.1~~GHVL01041296.1.p1  ORF type:complete len:186 (+),score=30.50 GHVL01041296.1:501-1058(+)